MKGDFTRFTHDPRKHYTRVLKQQGRVDLDADWNEAVEIFTRRDRIEATDVIGRCGAPVHGGGFRVEATPDGSGLTVTPGRLWVDGILCEHDAPGPVSLTEQDDLPGYELPDEDGVYLVYVDVWDRHVTALEDPEIREEALGGPDTTTRTRTVCQVRLHRIADDESLDLHECRPYPADPGTGTLAAHAEAAGDPADPCAVPEGAGYTGLENRLYRVEIHDDGRDEDGTPGARPVTFKWSRDNGSVVLPVADDNGIDGDTVTVARFGFDDVLTVRVGDWVEILGDETELHGRRGTLAQIVPDGIDRADREVELDRDVSAHAAEGHLKVRRWDHRETEDVALVDGALPLPAGPFELEDGVFVEFDPAGTYHVGDHWVVPARTRAGTVLWPREGTPPEPVALPPLGIHHHYCTLALARRSGGSWTEPRDCRPLFPPLTEVGDGGCCLTVEPGDDVQQALDAVVAAGGGCVALCEGVHHVSGPLRIRDGSDVRIHGEGPATVVRFAGTDEAGLGGLVVESGRRISVEDLVLASDDVPALVTLRHGPELGLARRIALRRLTLLNLAASDGETDFRCALRLGHAEGVVVEECRMAAEVGVLSLWGDALPDLAAAPPPVDQPPVNAPAPTPGAAPPAIILGFEELDEGSEFRVGDSFQEGGATVTGEPYQHPGGDFTEDGFSRVDDEGIAGGSGQDLEVNNILLAFGLPAPYRNVRIPFGELGGNVNLRVNGELRNVPDFSSLDGEVVGGVRVGVTMSDEEHGLLALDAETRDVEEMAIGGQELWIDDVAFRLPGEVPAPPVLAYGDGVADLRMRDTAIRFRDLGVLAARAHDWRIDGCDVRPRADEAWSAVAAAYAGDEEPADGGEGPADRLRHRRVLGALEEVFATAGEARGYALLAFRWHDCAVRDCTLGGRHGLHAWWWLGGTAGGNRVGTGESGYHAFWLHRAAWEASRVETADGLALSVAGCARARIEHNHLRGPVGVANLPREEAMDGLDALTGAILRGYGTDTEVDTALVRGILVDESLDIMGLAPLMDALQPLIDEEADTPGIPAAYYLAPGFVASLRDPDDGGFFQYLPLVDLQVVHNDVACATLCVAFDGFLPLGSLRVAANRIHTTTGQAVRVRTNPFLANAHLTVALVRILLALLADLLESTGRDADGPLADILDALRGIVAGWVEGIESLLDLDFRIEANTVRSLRTAIESNLFELSVLTNHVTMQERSLRAGPGESTGLVFGRVLTVQGGPVPGATVRAVGTQRAVLTNQAGEYRMPGLPAGSYVLRATQAGVAADEVAVELGEGEQVEVDFVLGTAPAPASFDGVGFSDRTVGAAAAAYTAGNPEIADVMRALEGSAALEPLAVALREGAHTMPDAYAGYLAGESGPLATAEMRNRAADAATIIQGRTSDPELRQAASELNTVLRANDRTGLNAVLVRFIVGLQRYVDSQGVLVAGVGGRIVENQVVVPADAREDTEALGGIQVSVNLAYVTVLSMLGTILARLLGGGTDDEAAPLDPLLGITDTLVDTNEVVGGVGHGISVQGVAGQPDFVQDLRIRGNQVRGMAGAGILVNEHALVVGMDVADNHVSACGRAAGFTQQKGGILVRTAAVCSIQGNHVLRCGDDLLEASAWGVDLDTLYGLRFGGNDVQANGSENATAEDGGLRLVEVYGSTLLHDNVLAFNRGLGLSWANSAREEEAALLPPFLLAAVNRYLRTTRSLEGLVEEEQASVQGNAFKGASGADLPLFQLLNLREVLFSGNSCQAETEGAPLGEIQMASRGVVSHNQTQTTGEVAIAIKKLADGVVLGNVGNRPIQLQASAGVESAFNVPPVT